MGNITALDIATSAVLVVFLLFMVYNSDARLNETMVTTGNELIVQEHLVNLVRIIEKDLRRIGYCSDQTKIPDPSQTIVSANRNGITFLTDVDNDGEIDTLQYSIGSPSSLSSTPNPRDMLFFRSVRGSASQGYSIGLTKFEFKFLNSKGDSLAFPITDPGKIVSMELKVALESTHPYDELYSYAAWRTLRLKARNLRER